MIDGSVLTLEIIDYKELWRVVVGDGLITKGGQFLFKNDGGQRGY
jgi:hypothetical protein